VETPSGSVQALYLVVDDIHAARAELLERGVEISEIQGMTAPDKPTVSYAYIKDPDGNGWALQKLPTDRRPPATLFSQFGRHGLITRKVHTLPRQGGGGTARLGLPVQAMTRGGAPQWPLGICTSLA
jgi:hypothetical protein